MKIIHLISSLSRGGRERQLAYIVANTNQTKYPTKILYFNSQENSYIDEYGLGRVSYKLRSNGKLSRMLELYKFLSTEKPDVVYTWGNGESIAILLLKPLLGFNFINGSVRHGIRSIKISHYIRMIILHLSKNVIANSRAGLQANRLNNGKVLYNGVDTKFLAPISNRKLKRLKLTGVPEEIPLLISVANMVPYKDYYSVLRALKELKDEGHAFYYLILGDGPLYSQIQMFIENSGLENDISILGHLSNVSIYLKICDIFIHSSKGEGCSNAILEAMAAGMPIIASNTGGTPEIVSRKNGFTFQYKKVNEIKEYILILLKNKDKRTELGANSKHIIVERFNIERMMDDYFELINQL